MPHSAIQIAKYFLTLINQDEGDTISNLALQKLLYYAQKEHLLTFRKPLFLENLIHWQYGPVVKEVYNEYKKYGSGAIDVEKEDLDYGNLDEATKQFLNVVFDKYGAYSAWVLSQMAHQEKPWILTKPNEIISNNLILENFDYETKLKSLLE